MKDNSNNISEELLETIERYLNDSLSSIELKDFERLLDIDEDFKAQVDDVKTMLFGIETQSLKEQLDDFHKEMPQTDVQKKIVSQKVRFLNYSKIAAAAAIIIAVGSIWFFSGSPNEKLYTKHFKPDPGLPTTMSSTDNFDFYDAMVNYKHADYDLAIEKWRVLSESQPENDTLNYFIGAAYLANKDADKAIPFLERATASEDDFAFLNDAYYYLGLAYLKEGNIELAKEQLNLSNTDSAKEILSKLTD
ncbi:tetratricopeptide repeat protein [Algibacter sp. 2305UL17-15]|uniref:tetratricopeptide repeat protein n=1 Tax=Algibacter sp. 2305UL17-15 TaxID=3231268 RepID=UPI0034578F2C